MKRMIKTISGFLLALLMVFGCISEAVPVLAKDLSATAMKSYKPEIKSIRLVDQTTSLQSDSLVYYYDIKLPEGDNYVIGIYYAEEKNGKYTYYGDVPKWQYKDGCLAVYSSRYRNQANNTMRYVKL